MFYVCCAAVEWQRTCSNKNKTNTIGKQVFVVEMLIFIFSCSLLHSHRHFSSLSVFHVVYSLNTIKLTKLLRIHKATVYSKQPNYSTNAFSHLIHWAMSSSNCCLCPSFCFQSRLDHFVIHICIFFISVDSFLRGFSLNASRFTYLLPLALFIYFQRQRNVAS